MSVFRNKITEYFTSRKINILILFFVLALILSLLSKLSKDHTVTVNLQINPIGVPEDYVILPDSSRSLAVTIRSHGFNLIPYYFSKQKIDLDLSIIEKNASNYLWTIAKGLSDVVDHFGSDIRIEAINPDSLFFNYDVNAVKMIPVVLKSKISFSPGYDMIEGFQIKPDSIKLIGPKVALDSITEVFTEELKLDEVNKDFSTSLILEVEENFNGLSLSQKEILITGRVAKFTEGAVDVPITVKNVPEGVILNYYPKTLSVLYFTSLNNLKTIDASSFNIECDYSQITEGSTFLIPKLVKQPKGIKNVRLDANRIEFIRTQ